MKKNTFILVTWVFTVIVILSWIFFRTKQLKKNSNEIESILSLGDFGISLLFISQSILFAFVVFCQNERLTEKIF